MSMSETLLVDDGAPKTDGKEYRSVLGMLQYLSYTQPDITYSVNKLTQFNTSPSVLYWKAVKHILRYLKETLQYGIRISTQKSTALCAYADADWAGDINDRRSISGDIVYLGTTPIPWSSRKQPTVSRSSIEAKYRAVASALSETNLVTHLLKDLHVSLHAAPMILCDNLRVTYIAENPVHHTKMKHLEVDLHFVRN
ncbi:hypothetical protein KY284_024121 [Solanum tuberosum]|nr:hypothetical protein KY284_024121 [Solanum tuberosum]